jgi:lipid II:glycine glycyltransferase (peptidoglycan interpeptide bridge formation enzyme)
MRIKELTIREFESFVDNHPLGNYYQSFNYARLMGENGYEYEFIGYVDEYDRIFAASLILIKKLSHFFKYGYAPKGFIIDYFNKKLLKDFTDDIIDYYKKKLIFIKINPEIAICEINPKTQKKEYNCNTEIKDYLIDLGYVKLKDNLYFESMIPRYNGIVKLSEFDLNNLEKNTRNKIRRAEAKGLKIELADRSGIDILFNFVKKKRNKDALYYKDYYNIFSKSNNVDLFLVSLDTKEYLVNAKGAYEHELDNNVFLNENLINHQNEKNINAKMNSDRKLLSYKNDVLEATRKSNENSKIYIGGALVIKYQNRINIVISGFDTRYRRFNANYLLHYKILDYYKKYYDFADLNGMTGDFTKNNPYQGLNRFKLGFKPKVYEFIGEYDLVINNTIYHSMLKSGKLAKIFNKTDIKK